MAMRAGVSVFVVGIALAGCGAREAVYPAAMAHPLLGKTLPHFRTRSTLDGNPVSSEGLAGKPVVVKFFADYCEPCKRTLPAAEQVHEAHAEVVFVGVDADERVNVARDVAARYGLTFPIVHDASRMLQGKFRVRELPITFVVDRAGIIRWVGGAEQSEGDLRLAVEAAMR